MAKCLALRGTAFNNKSGDTGRILSGGHTPLRLACHSQEAALHIPQQPGEVPAGRCTGFPGFPGGIAAGSGDDSRKKATKHLP